MRGSGCAFCMHRDKNPPWHDSWPRAAAALRHHATDDLVLSWWPQGQRATQIVCQAQNHSVVAMFTNRRSAALLHPLIMGTLFGATGWAGWLGWQWRRTRTIGDDIKALKAQMPKPAAGEAEATAAPAALTQQLSTLEKV